MIAQPIVFGLLLGYFAQPQQVSFRDACLLAAILVFLNFVQSLLGPHIAAVQSYCAQTWNVAIKGLIYKKVHMYFKSTPARTVGNWSFVWISCRCSV